MNSEINYTDEPMELGEIVADFLPLPSQLVPKVKTVQVTLELTEESVQFFQKQADQHEVSCEEMIRSFLDRYARQRLSP